MNRTGNFIDGDTIRGVESNAIYTLGSFSTIDNESTEFDQNESIEDGADDIDWGERNPFGEFGNYTGKLLMLGVQFYNEAVRKTVITFGTLFNNIELKKTVDGQVMEVEKVPLAYGPKQKFLYRLQGNAADGRR